MGVEWGQEGEKCATAQTQRKVEHVQNGGQISDV